MSNYRYCAVQKKCIAINAQCNANETQYTRGDGCPVTKKCDIGVDGNFFLDTGLQIQGGLDTSKDNEIRFKNMTIDIDRANPNNFPCAMVLFNIPKKELNFQISGPNVGVQIMKVNYPNRVTKDSLNPFNPTSQFSVLPENDMTIVYIGSTASISGLEAGPAVIRWENKKGSAVNHLLPNSGLSLSVPTLALIFGLSTYLFSIFG